MVSFSSDLQLYVSITVAVLAVVIVSVYLFLKSWSESAYDFYKNDPLTLCDIDSYVSSSDYNQNPPNKLKVSFIHKVQVRGFSGRTARTNPYIPIECIKSTHVDGLFVSRRATGEVKDGEEKATPLEDVLALGSNKTKTKKPTVVIATIRMGFGHHRIAYSVASWAMSAGYTTIFHDFLNIESDEANLIKTLDHFYSKFSRIASEFGGYAEKAWGQAMKQGDADGLRAAALTAAQLQPLLKCYPLDTPIVCTHQICALVASACGFTNVINLVVDNYPQWFLVVPKTINLTQGPVNYQSYLKMGIPFSELKLAGHWCPYELVTNIPLDCQRRIQRSTTTKPRRLLIPIGGAGAQKTFLIQLIQSLEPQIKNGTIQLFLNAGDHIHMKVAFEEILQKCSFDYELITTTQGVYDFQKKLLNGDNEPNKPITLFAFDEYFPAVATTDILCRVSDILTCKPSELAFYPIPKLHIRRVGDHEEYSAIRSAEVNDGSLETRTIPDTIRYIELLTNPNCNLLAMWNEQIIINHQKLNMYNGCKNAVKWAVEASTASD
ncbi:hypothetical protein FRACYDRAFT_193278 [Fragilariopsis cylindrus CCMP1102]|uniref:Uncharacterized protein n=1 Tax=Fragilariopsis cylindrus CCMP1102 TaxID=635003 RepID=A0A1E7EYJ7_9STRA|nr:hypothetical protein FRACYDRAFT_193278 [Fragilariopsis cylindrus CCMP1102]|eukprot:OEU10937.1 hypothetical protein FRACYDRAFT_193278 [Fragilariopsis cylindrus CCMP1102]